MATEFGLELLDEIQKKYEERAASNKQIRRLERKIADNSISYEQVNQYAENVGRELSKSLKKVLTEDRVKYLSKEVAEDIFRPLLTGNYNKIASVLKLVQENKNKESKIGLAPLVADLNTSRIDGIIEKVSSEKTLPQYMLGEPIINYSQAIVDDTAKANMEMQTKAGMNSKIIRVAEAGACMWCRKLEGTFDYSKVKATGNNVYRRHEYCRCIVTFENGKKRQDVWSKTQWEEEENKQRKTDIEKLLELQREAEEQREEEEFQEQQAWESYLAKEKKLQELAVKKGENAIYYNPKDLETMQKERKKAYASYKTSEERFKGTIEFNKMFQDGAADENSFFFDTIAIFENAETPNRSADYISYGRDGNVSSRYWYTEEGVYRRSNHWGWNVASCDWALAGDGTNFYGTLWGVIDVKNQEYTGFVKWEDIVKKPQIIKVANKSGDVQTIVTTFKTNPLKDEYVLNGEIAYQKW